jgi:hypothetical protein
MRFFVPKRHNAIADAFCVRLQASEVAGYIYRIGLLLENNWKS